MAPALFTPGSTPQPSSSNLLSSVHVSVVEVEPAGKPTTLSGAASQSIIDVPRRSRKGFALAMVAAALIACGSVALFKLDGPASETKAAATSPAAPTAAPPADTTPVNTTLVNTTPPNDTEAAAGAKSANIIIGEKAAIRIEMTALPEPTPVRTGPIGDGNGAIGVIGAPPIEAPRTRFAGVALAHLDIPRGGAAVRVGLAFDVTDQLAVLARR